MKSLVVYCRDLSNFLFNEQLENVGFRRQNAKYEPAECSLAGLFQPYKERVYPINVAWKLNHKDIKRGKDKALEHEIKK